MNLKGKKYEDIAINFLTRKGYDIIAKNFSCKMGEIDIIALRKGVLHFVEVKGGKDTFGDPAFRVNSKKLEKIMEVGDFFISKNKQLSFEEVQIDVISVTDEGKINYYPSQRL
ncbi:MAG TPA: YraN family protein [Defluviitoga sp.]|nr:YraN family protein [Defluviitoga sp.]HOP23730.1 YraN family protein [Defluviitoga sp.]HPZ28940.1 YraN family protein [Defluviitoga sp.]HQD62985.1 YraN family protein [Defluviitoga sp.]